jgi:hypothetical protein
VPSLRSLCLKRVRLLKLHLPVSETLRAADHAETQDAAASKESVAARVLPSELCMELIHFGQEIEMDIPGRFVRARHPQPDGQNDAAAGQELPPMNRHENWWEDRVVWMADQTATIQQEDAN